jgi:hypothetical protein
VKSTSQVDTLVQAIASLPLIAPDVSRAEALRARCRTSLESSAESQPLPVLEPTVGVACALYALHLARVAFMLSR